jgi:3-oxoadipate enol-lactonase
MPFAEHNGLHVRLDGDAARPCLVLSNSLGTDLSMWDAQAEQLAADFFVVRYDTRGHGQSARGSGELTIERLGRDVLALLDHLGVEQAAFCGISMGGLTGQWLGIHAPERFSKLILANTAARIGNSEGWTARAAQVRQSGMDPIADGAPARWFTEDFIARAPGTVARMVSTLRAQAPEAYADCCDALARADLRAEVANIAVPTLAIAGEHDPVTTVADAQWLCERIPHARMATVPASHISNIEAAAEFTVNLSGFLRT